MLAKMSVKLSAVWELIPIVVYGPARTLTSAMAQKYSTSPCQKSTESSSRSRANSQSQQES